MFSKKRPTGAPHVTLRQLHFGVFTVSREGQKGRLEGNLGRYEWKLSFNYEDDPFDDDYWLWDYTFTVTLKGVTIYSNTRCFINVPKTVFGEPYVRQVCEDLAQEFIDEGPAS